MRCHYCGAAIEFGCQDWERMATRDHQNPGQPYNPIVLSCMRCNSRKGPKTVEQYRDYLFFKTPWGRSIQLIDLLLTTGQLSPAGSRALEAERTRLTVEYPKPQFFDETAVGPCARDSSGELHS